MSYQELRHLIAMIGTIILTSLFTWTTYNRYYTSESFNNPTWWVTAIMWFIPSFIVMRIVLEIVLAIGKAVKNAAEGKEDSHEDPTQTDERDDMIESKALRKLYTVFMIGFVASLATQLVWFDWGLGAMFVGFSITMFFSILIGDALHFWYYRRGF